MISQFTIPREKIEQAVKDQIESVLGSASIDYEVETEHLETLGGDRHYQLYAVIDVQIKIPVIHLVEDQE